MRKHTPRNTKKIEKPEITYTRLVKAYYYQAFATLDARVVQDIIPEGTEPLPVDIFLLVGRREDKELYHDPAPRSLSPLINFIVGIHNRVINDIAENKMDLISVLMTVPPTKIPQLNQMSEPRGIVSALIRNQIITTGSRINADVAINAMMIFVKALVEAMINCIAVYKRLPGAKSSTYLLRLCQGARMPKQIMQLAYPQQEVVTPIVAPPVKKIGADDHSSSSRAESPVPPPIISNTDNNDADDADDADDTDTADEDDESSAEMEAESNDENESE